MRKCKSIIYTLTEYEFLILGSKHPKVFFTDHQPINFFLTQKPNPNHRLYRFQFIPINFPYLHITWKQALNLLCQIHLVEINHLNYLHEKEKKKQKNSFSLKDETYHDWSGIRSNNRLLTYTIEIKSTKTTTK